MLYNNSSTEVPVAPSVVKLVAARFQLLQERIIGHRVLGAVDLALGGNQHLHLCLAPGGQQEVEQFQRRAVVTVVMRHLEEIHRLELGAGMSFPSCPSSRAQRRRATQKR